MFTFEFEDEPEEKKRSPKKSPNNTLFTLKNINRIEIDKKYVSDDLLYKFDDNEEIKTITSKIEHLQLSTIKSSPHEKIKIKNMNINIYVGMKDVMTKSSLPQMTTISCWNDSEPFQTQPFGIPVKYHQSYLMIKSGEYTNYQFLTTLQRIKYQETKCDKNKLLNELKELKKKPMNDKIESQIYKLERKINEQLVVQEYYDTHGIFCNFGCMLCYIYSHRNNLLYKNSIPLLRQMIKDQYKLEGKVLNKPLFASPNVKLLKKFGGPLSIEEYRDISKHVDHPTILFFDTNQVKRCENNESNEEKKPLMRPVGSIFQQIEKE